MLDRALAEDDAAAASIAGEAARAGVSAIQLRDKGRSQRKAIRLAQRLRRICARHGVPFIVNDRVDVALAADADGLHIGQSDIPVSLARSLVGPDKIIGVSVGSAREAKRAQGRGADYVGVGPVFATPIKKGTRPIADEEMRAIAALDIPAILIGGIDMRNAPELASCGFRRIAVIRAVMGSRTPGRTVKMLAEIMSGARQ